MRQRLTNATWIMLALAVMVVPSQSAMAGPRDHIGGFFLRMSAGGGAASTGISNTGDSIFNEIKFSGGAGDFNFALGGMVAHNLALHGTFWGWFVSTPDLEVNNQSVGTADGDYSMAAFGGGLTYYFMPVNIYLTGSVGAGSLSASNNNTTVNSGTGLAFDLGVGKEWWLGSKWGMGLAAGMSYHSVPDGDESITQNWTGTSYALRLSVTYN